MGKIKTRYRSIPLWLAIFLFTAAALLVASAVSDGVTRAARYKMSQIGLHYVISHTQNQGGNGIVYETVTGDAGEIVSYKVDMSGLPASDARLYRLCRLTVRIAPAVIYTVCLLTAVLLLYLTKLKKPLSLLVGASAKIAKNDFAFSLEYPGRDEMAELCAAFEKMRRALDENNAKMNRMIEERKQLNDAYTHDLRTPIAVLKGYTDTLAEYLPTGRLSKEKVIETIHTMSAHVERLRQFVDSMNTAQKLADLPIRREAIPTRAFVAGLRETTVLLCEKQGISCRVIDGTEAEALSVDPAAVTQVFENLLGNALRFARSEIAVSLKTNGHMLYIRVADDGRGFSEQAPAAAAKPYAGGVRSEGACHFGLGLYICRMLCEKHGGGLKTENGENGGAVVTASFSSGEGNR